MSAQFKSWLGNGIQLVLTEATWYTTQDEIADAIRNHISCLYIMRNPYSKQVLKIGIAKNIYDRRYNFKHKFKGIDPQYVALIEHEQYRFLERMLHLFFDNHRQKGEWFDSDIVASWFDFAYAMTQGEVTES